MYGGSLHSEDGTAAVFDELLEHGLSIVILTVGESGEGTYADEVAVATHDGNGFEQVFALVAIHDDATLCFQFPGTGIDVEHDDIHAEVHGGLLG